jgi:hypothetical protein
MQPYNILIVMINNNHQMFKYVCGTTWRESKTSNKEKVLKLYKVMAVPLISYGCENHRRRTETKR